MKLYEGKTIFRAFTQINGRVIDINNQVRVLLDIEKSFIEGNKINYVFNLISAEISFRDWSLQTHLSKIVRKTHQLLSIPISKYSNTITIDMEDRFYIIESDMKKIKDAFYSIDKIGSIMVKPLYMEQTHQGDQGLRHILHFSIIGAKEDADKLITITKDIFKHQEKAKQATLSLISDIVSSDLNSYTKKDFWVNDELDLISIEDFDSIIRDLEFLPSTTGDRTFNTLSVKFIDITI